MTEVISSALNFMRLSFNQSLAELFQAVADRGVEDVLGLSRLLGGVHERVGVRPSQLGRALVEGFHDDRNVLLAGTRRLGNHAALPPRPLGAAGSSAIADSTRRV